MESIPKTALVVGATGAVGRELVRQMCSMSLCHISAENRNSDVFLITYLPVG